MTNEITPFRIRIPQADLDDLHDRLARTRWAPVVAAGPDDWSRGIPTAHLRRLAERWHGFDWRAAEARLNAFPQFTTDIDGERLHFVHVRSRRPDALPLLLLHGYPGSFAEFERIIGPLAEDFHVVVPSLPGFGFSTAAGAGWAMPRTARALATLMARLGYDRYAAQGGDIGAGLTGALAGLDTEHVVAVHVNSDPLAVGYITSLLAGGTLADPDGELTADDERELARMRAWLADGTGYLGLQTTRPQTIGHGLADSPVLQLAWIAEKFAEWTDPAKPLPEDAVDLDQLLTIVSLYWFTGTGATAAKFLWESAHSHEWIAADETVPVGWAMFGGGAVVRRLVDPGRRIAHWTQFGHGGHFAALETPGELVADVREFFRSVMSKPR